MARGATSGTTTHPTWAARLFSFPNPVNEVSARLVAGGVVLLALATIVFDQPWLTVVIAYGFVARALTGPTLSPLGQLVTRVITPRLPVAPKLVAGPPKRFAQGIGVVFSDLQTSYRIADTKRAARAGSGLPRSTQVLVLSL